jgi:thermitase
VRLVRVPRERREQIAKVYRASALVESVDLDAAIGSAWTPDDPQLAAEWALDTIGAAAAWDLRHGATSARVAILDSGIDSSHPDLAGRVVLSTDFTGSGTGDRFGHGTAVAGIIAAGLDNGMAGLSTAPLLDGKILDDDGVGLESTMLEGIVWATDHGARVINLSVGAQRACSPAVQTTVDYAWTHGAVVVAAAGNDGTQNVAAPASCDHTVAVGATDANDARASFSNYGPGVSLAAPGASILTTTVDGGYSAQDGTSLAAAHVSGAAALVWATRWGTSNQAVVDRLLGTAKRIPGTGSAWQAGRLDLAAAVGAAPSPPGSPSPSATPTRTVTPSATPTDDPVIYPLACRQDVTLGDGSLTLSPNVDPSTATNATGSTTASITMNGACSGWALSAQLPASPSLPANTVYAACNGGSKVALSTTQTAVCTGSTAGTFSITYTVQNSWSLTNQTTTLSSITWTVS